MIQQTLTLKMTAAQVVETSVTVNNSPIQDHLHPADHAQPTYGTTRSCTVYLLWGQNWFWKKISVCWLKTLLSEIPWSSGGVENSSGDAESSRWSLSLPTAKTKQARLLFLTLFHYNFHYVSAGPCWNESFLYQRVCTAEATRLLT